MAGGKTVATIVLRGLATISYLTATILMFVSFEKIDHNSYGYEATIRFSQWSALPGFAVVNLIGSAYNLLILCVPSGSPLWKTIVVLDVVINLVLGISLGIGWQTFSLFKNGNISVGWSPVCSVFSQFCSKILGSMAICSFGFLVSFCLSMFALDVSVDPLLVGPQ